VNVHLDTSVLVEAFIPRGPIADSLRALAWSGDRPAISALAFFEWLRGPRTPEELALREALFPDSRIVEFGAAEAIRAADLYRKVRKPRGREADLEIAACAIEHDAALWTANLEDFRDIPSLRLYQPLQ
jgi:predicted nucleic acid-binding protein